LGCFNQEAPDEELPVFNPETKEVSRPGNYGIARRRTGYVVQTNPRIDAAKAEKNRFRMKTELY